MTNQRPPPGFFYDGQIGRYLGQIIRMFSNFYVREFTRHGERYHKVPARYGDPSRMVAHITRENSENFLNTAPFMTISIQSLQPNRERQQDPHLVDTQQVAERRFSEESGTYTSEQGNRYTVERYMPVPYALALGLDIWTTNTDTKLQILEQISVLFNTTIQLQVNQNPLDWSSVFELEMTDLQWSSRSVPVGTEDPIDVATITFTVPIWISPPAKVKRQSIIQRIVADIHAVEDVSELNTNGYYDFFGTLDETDQIIVTPGDYLVRVEGNEITLLNAAGLEQSWVDFIEIQGEITSVSKIRLNADNVVDSMNVITGFVSVDPNDDAKLILRLDEDTLPADTLLPVDKIIDPRGNGFPGGDLPPAYIGQRYLVNEMFIGEAWPDSSWGTDLNVNINDIIEYVQVGDSAVWRVVFDAETQMREEFVTNTFTGNRYKWNGEEWISTYEGTYNAGFWSLVL